MYDQYQIDCPLVRDKDGIAVWSFSFHIQSQTTHNKIFSSHIIHFKSFHFWMMKDATKEAAAAAPTILLSNLAAMQMPKQATVTIEEIPSFLIGLSDSICLFRSSLSSSFFFSSSVFWWAFKNSSSTIFSYEFSIIEGFKGDSSDLSICISEIPYEGFYSTITLSTVWGITFSSILI